MERSRARELTFDASSLLPRNCPKCKKARTATKSLSLSRLPPVLLIHLKRFSSKNGVFWDKAETLVGSSRSLCLLIPSLPIPRFAHTPL